MKRFIYAVVMLLMTVSGCEYHPYYDGQVLRIYNADHGIIETDGNHIYVPIVGREPFVLEIYGGIGKRHAIHVEDPEYLKYTYEERKSATSILGEEMHPASLTLLPQMTGDTSLTITDEDTGESIQMYVHIIKAYSMIEVEESQNSLETGIMLAFEYPDDSEIVKIGRKNTENGDIEYLLDAGGRFLYSESSLYLELSYPSDASGQPSADGEMTVRLYHVQSKDGYDYGDPWWTLTLLNLDYMNIQTRSVMQEPQFYLNDFKFTDVTDNNIGNAGYFLAKSAQLKSFQ